MAAFNQLSGESITRFQEGISLTLSNWSDIQAGFDFVGGNQNHLANSIFHFFHQPNRREPISVADLDRLLWETLVSFGIVLEDHSTEEKAEDLMTIYRKCLEGNFESIQRLREQRSVLARVTRQVVNDSDDDEEYDDDDDDMMVDTQESLPNANPSPMLRKNKGRNN